MKAVSTVIAIILIILIVIVLAVLMYVFLRGILLETAEAGTISINKTVTILSSCMYIDSAAENKVYLRNCGKGVIASNKLAVYLDDTIMDFEASSEFAYEDELMIIIPKELWRFTLGKHNLRITGPSIQASKSIETFRSDSKAVLAFKFDEGSGTTAFDSSDNDNDGSLKNTTDATCFINGACPDWILGKYGEALQFDGIGDYVVVPHDETLRIDDKNFTIEAWIKTSSTSSPMAIADVYTQRPDMDVGWIFSLDEGKIKLYIGQDSPRYSASALGIRNLRDGLWHYVFGNYNGTHIQVYVDGEIEGNTEFTGNIWYSSDWPDPNKVLHIGLRCDACAPQNKGQQFDGIIDEVRVYNVSFSPYELVMLKLRI